MGGIPASRETGHAPSLPLRRARLRATLGFVQMGGASFTLALLLFSGMSRATLFAFALTTLATLSSLLLFRGKH